MPAIKWDQDGYRFYETGVDHGVLYPMLADGTYAEGVAWNGLTSVSESPSGAEETKLYADNNKYLSLRSKEEFGATIEAYTYPDEWAECDGSAELVSNSGIMVGQQTRKSFGLCYRTRVGNDTEYEDYGYKIHIIYKAQASPSQKSYSTINDSPEAITFSYELTTTPTDMPKSTGLKPSATLIIDSNKCPEAKLKRIEDMLYGTDPAEGETGTGTPPQLPTPEQIITILSTN
jgi:hypothetical protein